MPSAKKSTPFSSLASHVPLASAHEQTGAVMPRAQWLLLRHVLLRQVGVEAGT